MRHNKEMLCIHRHEELPSTNDEAIRMARAGAPEGTLVWAERQTAGRGRRGRGWDSPAGNVYLSVVLRPNLPMALAGRLSVACAAGLAASLREATSLPVRTKWPNDLYLEGRKAGGLLVETRLRPGGMLDWAIAGLGLNVASHPAVAPPGAPATSLAAHGGGLAPESLVARLGAAIVTAGLDAATPDWETRVLSHWAESDLAAGAIRVLEGEREYEAVGMGLDTDGALLVQVGEQVRRLMAGEVSLRPRPET